jgi:hypothetical protein
VLVETLLYRKVEILLTLILKIMSSKRKSFSERILSTSPDPYVNPIKLDVEESNTKLDSTTISDIILSGVVEVPTTRELYVESSPATFLVQDIINSVIETGRPPYSDTLFVDSGFSFQEPKKKERTFGSSGLMFPKNCYIGIFPAEYQFCSREALITFLGGLDTKDPYEVRDKVKEKFAGCPIGIVGGRKGPNEEIGVGEPGATYNVFWLDEKTRIYYDPYEKKVAEILPLIIII